MLPRQGQLSNRVRPSHDLPVCLLESSGTEGSSADRWRCSSPRGFGGAVREAPTAFQRRDWGSNSQSPNFPAENINEKKKGEWVDLFERCGTNKVPHISFLRSSVNTNKCVRPVASRKTKKRPTACSTRPDRSYSPSRLRFNCSWKEKVCFLSFTKVKPQATL